MSEPTADQRGPDHRSEATRRAVARPPLWRDVRFLQWAFQLAVVAVVAAIFLWLWNNLQVNSQRQNLPTSFSFLDQPAGFPISGSDFRTSQPVRAALVEGFYNTLRLAISGMVLATVLGTLIGIARLSKNFLVRKAAQFYVEFIRNVPLLLLITLFYFAVALNAFPPARESWTVGPLAVLNVRGVSLFWFEGHNLRFVIVLGVLAIVAYPVARWRRMHADRTGNPAHTGLWAFGVGLAAAAVAWILLGLGASSPERVGLSGVEGGITMTPEYFAVMAGLVVYTASHIAEIVRGSIQAVHKGQGEAANALALSGFQRMWFVVLPQAFRIAMPPIGNQYLNLTKNSSLAAVIAFPELTQVVSLSVSNRSPAVPAFALLLLIYLALSLAISLVVNVVNRRLAIVER